ncbi:MAG: ribosome biogenesis GTPase Der [Bacteroidales bacterium]|nr:ribosome biogenesis GTPase Der [Bacteroidales bacterium]MDD6002634.1 ribosome biogenesis GTPase Der [Bacteroidales bacterium]
MSNIVAIVGCPNVGKSTFFNRLTQSRDAIVHETAGVTRDRHYGKSDWNGKEFSVIDTGGYVNNSDDIFENEIQKQVHFAIEEADAIIFMVDANLGVTAGDEVITDILRRADKPVFLTVNKTDNPSLMIEAQAFYSLGLGDIYTISSASGSGTGDLLDAVVATFTSDKVDDEAGIPKIAIVGRPNVGKSSFINALTGTERNIVTPIAGTTRDPINTRYQKFGHDFILVDTAGLRKKSKVSENIEFYSVLRSVRAIEEADVCILMLDATQGLESQDMNIFRLIKENNKGLVVVVNKWDLVDKSDDNSTKKYEEYVKKGLEPFDDIPVIFTSTVTKQRVLKAMESAVRVYENRTRKISTSQLNKCIQQYVEETPPPSWKGKFIKVKYATQLPTYYPTFALFCNLPQYIRDPYKRYIENRLRKDFDFCGVPIKVFFRKK